MRGAWKVGLPNAFTVSLQTPLLPKRGFTHILPKPQPKSLWQLGSLAGPGAELVPRSGAATFRHALPDELTDADAGETLCWAS